MYIYLINSLVYIHLIDSVLVLLYFALFCFFSMTNFPFPYGAAFHAGAFRLLVSGFSVCNLDCPNDNYAYVYTGMHSCIHTYIHTFCCILLLRHHPGHTGNYTPVPGRRVGRTPMEESRR